MSDWKVFPVQKVTNGCARCGSKHIEYRAVDQTEDGSHDDECYHCLACDHYWWVEDLSKYE